jgi:hypothetical protein
MGGIIFLMPLISIPLIKVLSMWFFLHEAILIRVRVWLENVDKIYLYPAQYNEGSTHNFFMDIISYFGYAFGFLVLIGTLYIFFSILTKISHYRLRVPKALGSALTLFFGMLIVISVQNTVNSGLSQPIALVIMFTSLNEVLKSLNTTPTTSKHV